MSSDQWQLLIGILAFADAGYLIRKTIMQKDFGIVAAILPRVWLGAWYLYDSAIQRATMEPARTVSFITLALLFFVANFSHIVEWSQAK